MARGRAVASLIAALILARSGGWAAADAATEKRLAEALEKSRSPEPSVRASALRALGNLDDPRALTALVAAVRDADVAVRLAAVQGLHGHVTQEATGTDMRSVDVLVGALNDDAAEVRAAAAESLDTSNPIAGKAVAALVAAVDDADHVVRRAAVGALGSIRDAAAFDALAAALAQTNDASLRAGAAEALGELGDPRAVPLLQAALKADDSAYVRARVARGLGRGHFGDGVVVSLRLAACGDKEPPVREAAKAALGEIGTPAALEAIGPKACIGRGR